MSQLAYYAFNTTDFNSGSSTTINDLSGNNYDLTKVITNSEGSNRMER